MDEDEPRYQTIDAPNRMAGKVATTGGPSFDEIEAAFTEPLRQLAERYPDLVRDVSARIRQLLRSAGDDPGSEGELDEVFRQFHDLKGQAATFGFPLIGEASATACDLLRARPAALPPPLEALRVCVDAVDLMAAQSIRDRSDPRGADLIENLEAASRKILASWR